MRCYLHLTIPPEVSPAPRSKEQSLLRDYPFPRLLAVTACSDNSVCSSDSLSCPNLSGWGGVKGRGWPPHMPGAFQCVSPELLSCCALAVLTENAFIPAGHPDNCSHMPLTAPAEAPHVNLFSSRYICHEKVLDGCMHIAGSPLHCAHLPSLLLLSSHNIFILEV